jgi:hypothetical protein
MSNRELVIGLLERLPADASQASRKEGIAIEEARRLSASMVMSFVGHAACVHRLTSLERRVISN